MSTRTTHYGVCPLCGGSGKKREPGWLPSDFVRPPCGHCHGTGRVVTHITEEADRAEREARNA